MLDFLKDHWKLIFPLILGLYEVVCRVIPTVSNISLLGKLITFLKWLSDLLNIEKEKKK